MRRRLKVAIPGRLRLRGRDRDGAADGELHTGRERDLHDGLHAQLGATSVTFAAGAATVTATLTAVADAVADPEETTILTLASGSGYGGR